MEMHGVVRTGFDNKEAMHTHALAQVPAVRSEGFVQRTDEIVSQTHRQKCTPVEYCVIAACGLGLHDAVPVGH